MSTYTNDPPPAEPELPTGHLTLPAPPRLERSEGAGGVLAGAVPMLGSLGSILIVAMLAGGGSGATMRMRGLLAGGVFLAATLAYVLVQVDRQQRQHTTRVNGARADHLHELAQARARIRSAAALQRAAMLWHHPEPRDLPVLATRRSRLWRRGPEDSRFLRVRIGRAAAPLSVELTAPAEAMSSRADPAATAAVHRLRAVHSRQPDLPAVLDLSQGGIRVDGPDQRVRALVRAVVCQTAAAHSPQHVAVAVLCSGSALVHWDWLKWLPHAHSTRRTDALGPCRMASTDPQTLTAMLPIDRRTLIVVDDWRDRSPPQLPSTATLVHLGASLHTDPLAPRRLVVSGSTDCHGRVPLIVKTGTHARDELEPAYADQLDRASAEAFARQLASWGASEIATDSPDPESQTGMRSLTELLGCSPAHEWEPIQTWDPRVGRDRLRVAIGTDPSGRAVHLDLKESAECGMGPHGLVIGATGSGKSEFLRTLVLGLAMSHSPEQLNLVLVDFKGGATFSGLAAMPHTSAVITNLTREVGLVDRMQDALTGELIRRQELLREAGNYASLRDYEQARSGGQTRAAAVPSLLVVVDEFAELLTARPELIELFVAIGRLGRSLGIHLLLASQRLEEGRLRGLESHLSYRIALRTLTASESRAVLGVPDAHELPAVPGVGYLRPSAATLRRFRSAYVSGPVDHTTPVPQADTNARIVPFSILPVEVNSAADAEPIAEAVPTESTAPGANRGESSVLELVVSRMSGRGPAAHPVWLPPLDMPDPLDQLMPDLAPDLDLGLTSASWRERPGLTVPLGSVDRPREQRRDPLVVDLAGAAGHAAVIGGPRSGRSTLLRTLVSALSLTRTPREVQFFALDFGGGTFEALTGLPHLAGAAGRSEPSVVRRIVAEVAGILDRRERHFREHGIDSIEAYRSRRGKGCLDDGYGDIVLVVDGWSTLKADFEDLEQRLHQVASRGLTYGVHLAVATGRWSDLRPPIRDLFGTRLELRLGDPADSELDRQAAHRVPRGRPGRGLVAGGLQVLGALPRIDGVADPHTLAEGTEDLVRRVGAAWCGPPAPPLRVLPQQIELATVRSALPEETSAVVLGVEEEQLTPVMLDPQRDPHLLVLGDGGSGKTATLRGYLHELRRTRTAREAQIVLVDYRRSLLGEVPEEYQLNYLTNAGQALSVIRDLVTFLEARLPGDDVTSEQLRRRSWWMGAEVYVIVDDYDVVAGACSPLSALVPLLAQAPDVGLHLVVARRTGGASRAMFDPVLQGLRELAQPGLLLSGDPDEGPVLGRLRPEAEPPGRGRLVTRDGGTQVVQVAWSAPAHAKG